MISRACWADAEPTALFIAFLSTWEFLSPMFALTYKYREENAEYKRSTVSFPERWLKIIVMLDGVVFCGSFGRKAVLGKTRDGREDQPGPTLEGAERGFNESPHSWTPTIAGARVQDKCMDTSKPTDDTSYWGLNLLRRGNRGSM